MRTARLRALPLVLGGLLVAAASAQQTGQVTEVRAYRGQALVTREIRFTAQAGPQELVVSGLPAQVAAESLYATADPGALIRTVRYREKPVLEEPREEVRQLDERLAALQDEQKGLASSQQLITQQSQYLDKLEAFVAPTAHAEMTRGVLNTQSLIELTTFAFEQRAKLAQQKLELDRRDQQLASEMRVVQQELAKLRAGGARLEREAVILVDAEAAGPARVELNYISQGVNWSPAYLVRLGGDRDKLTVEYHAVVQQVSGEDWDNVKLSLSTSHPTMLADAPMLAPLWIALGDPAGERIDAAPADADGVRAYQERQVELRRQLQAGRVEKPAAPGLPATTAAGRPATLPTAGQAPDLNLNILAGELQAVELTAADDVVQGLRRSGSVSSSAGLSVEYPIGGQVSLQSRADQQMFMIAEIELEADFRYVAVPLLTDYVYRSVRARNSSELPLLAGPYNAYLDGAFSGRGVVPEIAPGQRLTLGFGAESQLRVARSLTDKQSYVRGGNQVISYTYQHQIQNYMNRPVAVQVWDRLPKSPDDQIAVTLTDAGPGLSTDSLYEQAERPRGLLRWDVEVPANASGPEAFAFTYAFQVEFDRTKRIQGVSEEAVERMMQDLEALRGLHGM